MSNNLASRPLSAEDLGMPASKKPIAKSSTPARDTLVQQTAQDTRQNNNNRRPQSKDGEGQNRGGKPRSQSGQQRGPRSGGRPGGPRRGQIGRASCRERV